MTGAYIWDPYCGAPPAPAGFWSQWNLDPVLLAGLAAGGVLWALSCGRSTDGSGRIAFAAAVAVLVVAFVSPLCALASALFSARVAHHMLTVSVAAPLLAIAIRQLPPTGSAWAWLVPHAASLWLWHAPGPYSFALTADGPYWLMQISLLLPAVLFWRGVFSTPAPSAAGALVLAMMQMGLLGGLITFAGQPLYAPHFAAVEAWGLTPLEDQQAAGLIMWVPASGVYLAAALVMGWCWLGSERDRNAAAA